MRQPTDQNIVELPQVLQDCSTNIEEIDFKGIVLDMFRQNPSFALGSVQVDGKWNCILFDNNELVESIEDVKWLLRYSYLIMSTPRTSASGLMRVHIYSKMQLQLNQLVHFKGVITHHTNEDTWEEMDVPTLHMTMENDIECDELSTQLSSMSFGDTRSTIVQKLTSVIGCPIIAEYMLLHSFRNGLANVNTITPIHFSFVNAPNLSLDANQLYFSHLLTSFLSQISESSCVLLNENKLNNTFLFPSEKEERIVANEMFFAPNTFVVLDENAILTEKLSSTAMSNASAFQDLFNTGKQSFHCSHGIVQVDCPLMLCSVSKEQSMLRKLVEFMEIPINTSYDTLKESLYNGVDFNGVLTESEIAYFKIGRKEASWNGNKNLLILDDAQNYIQQYYTQVRKNGIANCSHQFQIQDLHHILYTARLVCRSMHTSIVTESIARKCVGLNEARLRMFK